MTGKFMLDVFGGDDFLTMAANLLGLRGNVLDTKFGPKYDVSQPVVLTSIRQDVSAGKCVAGMISPPRQHTSSVAISNLLHRARRPWILEHPCDSWLWNVPKIEALAARPRTAWALAECCIFVSQNRNRMLLLVGSVDSRDLYRIADVLGWADVAVLQD